MSVWRRKAIECLPEFSGEFQKQETSIYDVFMRMLPAAVQAHKNKDNLRLQSIYSYAEWCFRQKEKMLWNAAGVAFYEHLGDCEETSQEIAKWVKPGIYKEIRGLLEWRLDSDTLKKLDRSYSNLG